MISGKGTTTVYDKSHPLLSLNKKRGLSLPRQRSLLRKPPVDNGLFETILKKTNYPYLSKVSLNRKRTVSLKRGASHSYEQSISTEHRPSIAANQEVGEARAEKKRMRYKSKPNEGASDEYRDRREAEEDEFGMEKSPARHITHNRSYFLKRLKQKTQRTSNDALDTSITKKSMQKQIIHLNTQSRSPQSPLKNNNITPSHQNKRSNRVVTEHLPLQVNYYQKNNRSIRNSINNTIKYYNGHRVQPATIMDKQEQVHIESNDMHFSSQKVTMIREPDTQAQQEHPDSSSVISQGHSKGLLSKSHGTQDDNNIFQVKKKKKVFTPEEIIAEYYGYLSPYEREIQIYLYPDIYCFGKECPDKLMAEEESKTDDAEGGYLWKEKDHVAYRFEFVSLLGEGSFGQVFKCFDHKSQSEVALKIVRNKAKYNKQAQTEIQLLEYVKLHDPHMNKNLVEIKQHFVFRKHTCMVFEMLSINLYELIKANDYYGLPLDLIRRFSLQILNGLHFLQKHNIIHADLKPENILLKQANKSGLKIIDFGSSCFVNQRIYTYIQSRYYRAPEVILGIPYDFKIDIWSFACVIAELYIGYPIFPGENQKDQMSLIMQTIGKPPESLVKEATRRHHYFDADLKPLPYTNSKDKSYEPNQNPLSMIIETKDATFCRFLQRCFVWEAQKRPTALQCLKHEWILEGLPQQIKKQHLKFVQQQQNAMALQMRRKSPKSRQINGCAPQIGRQASIDRSRHNSNPYVRRVSKNLPTLENRRRKFFHYEQP